MVNSGVPIDPVLLIDRLRGDSDYENSGGQEYIINLADACPAPSNAKYYAQIVSDKYKLRRLITASRAIIDDATEQAENTSLILDAAEQRLFDIRSEGEVKGLERISSVILQTFDRLDDLNSEADSNTRAIPDGHRRPRPHDHRAEPLRSDHSRGASRYGKDELRAQYRAQRRLSGEENRRVFLA